MNDHIMHGNIAERKQVRQSKKAWKYIRDVNNTSLSDLSRIAVEDGNRISGIPNGRKSIDFDFED